MSPYKLCVVLTLKILLTLTLICAQQLPDRTKYTENRESCPRDRFRCNYVEIGDHPKPCISTYLRCDGYADCRGESTDEIGCAGTDCEAGQFRCDSGQCVQSLLCDAVNDCQDGSDEKNCKTCAEFTFKCEGGGCVPLSQFCDYKPDCSDGSDEIGCRRCSSNEFRCKAGKCIPRSAVCNYDLDCPEPDNSDEMDCYNLTANDIRKRGAVILDGILYAIVITLVIVGLLTLRSVILRRQKADQITVDVEQRF